MSSAAPALRNFHRQFSVKVLNLLYRERMVESVVGLSPPLAFLFNHPAAALPLLVLSIARAPASSPVNLCYFRPDCGRVGFLFPIGVVSATGVVGIHIEREYAQKSRHKLVFLQSCQCYRDIHINSYFVNSGLCAAERHGCNDEVADCRLECCSRPRFNFSSGMNLATTRNPQINEGAPCSGESWPSILTAAARGEKCLENMSGSPAAPDEQLGIGAPQKLLPSRLQEEAERFSGFKMRRPKRIRHKGRNSSPLLHAVLATRSHLFFSFSSRFYWWTWSDSASKTTSIGSLAKVPPPQHGWQGEPTVLGASLQLVWERGGLTSICDRKLLDEHPTVSKTRNKREQENTATQQEWRRQHGWQEEPAVLGASLQLAWERRLNFNLRSETSWTNNGLQDEEVHPESSKREQENAATQQEWRRQRRAGVKWLNVRMIHPPHMSVAICLQESDARRRRLRFSWAPTFESKDWYPINVDSGSTAKDAISVEAWTTLSEASGSLADGPAGLLSSEVWAQARAAT
ncbi:hypothetical protein C8J57DRAFT_1234801 [Mycena rebaudengoi]|nr:hypothetical protein C8J57DRAFT_1234801 [Mycena rebaudengoi]